MSCPDDTNGDGDCGKPACPHCGTQAAVWSYNSYRALLMKNGEFFAILTPDGRNSVPTAKGEEIVGTLNGVEALRVALAESVKLQAHYAELLNQYDGGKRMIFKTPEAWMARLKETKTPPLYVDPLATA